MSLLGRSEKTETATQPIWKHIGWVAASLFIILSLHANIAVIQTDNNNSWILDILRKINNSYTRIELFDLLALVTIPLAYRYLREKGSGRDWRALLLAGVFAVLYGGSRSIQGLGNFGFFNENSYQRCYSLICLLGWFLLFDLLLRLAFTAAEQSRKTSPTKSGAKRIRCISFFAIVIFWLPWTLSNYPGTFCLDSYNQIGQYMGDIPWTSYSPVFSTWLMGTLVSLGDLVGDRNFGCYLYLLLQTIMGGAIFSFGLGKIYKMGAGTGLCLAITGFFALTPVWGLFAQWYEKDLLYGELGALNLLLAFDVVRTGRCGKETASGLAFSGILMSLARNNGIYAAVPLLVALVLFLKKRERLKATCSLVALLSVYLLVTLALYPALGIQGGSIRDLLGIPAQQTARYVAQMEDSVTAEEREAIDAVFDYDRLSELYIPTNADNIKNTYKEDDSKLPDYFRSWLRMGLKHPGVYLEAFMAKSYGYLAPVERDSEVHVMPNAEELNKYGIYSPLDSRFARGFEFISKLGANLPVINYLLSPGLYVWIMLSCIALIFKHRKYSLLILFIPALVNTAFCIGSPLHNSIRYSLPVAATLPFLLALVYCSVSNPTESRMQELPGI